MSGFKRRELDQWEKKFPPFQSQRFIYEDVFDKDELHKNEINKLSEVEIEELKEKNGDLFFVDKSVFENRKLFTINEDGFFSLKIIGNERDIEKFVNSDGLLQIGDSIFEYKDNYIKVILDGKEEKINQLKNAKISGEVENVMVFEIVKQAFFADEFNGKILFEGPDDCIGYTSGGGQRVRGMAHLGLSIVVDVYGTYGYPGQVISRPLAYLEAINEIHNVFGWSKKRTEQLSIDGSDISYNVGSYSGSNISGTVGTNGELEKEIRWYILVNTAWAPGTTWTPYLFSGDVIFRGRHGSQCSL